MEHPSSFTAREHGKDFFGKYLVVVFLNVHRDELLDLLFHGVNTFLSHRSTQDIGFSKIVT
ncbi:MAG: hypothetical protein ABII80_00335, partial [bacterium]